MKDIIIVTEENKERWIIKYDSGVAIRQEFRRDYRYHDSNKSWFNDVTIKIENLKKVVDKLQ